MEEIKPKKERKFLKVVGNIAKVLANELVMGIARKFIGKAIDKVGNKRQGLVIAFALVAGISYASIDSIPYPVTGNKQRLGWQTTGNGLVYRGRSNDTITKPSSYVDKNVKAYLLLDSVRGTIFVWRQTYWDSILVGGGAFAQPIDSLFFNTGVPTNNVDTAKMRWDSDLATVVLGLNDNVPNEIGFKNFWLVKNQTGSTITKGSLVYANGTVGASGRITVDKFIANGSIDAKYLLGITAHDLTDGEDGYVISFGKIRQVNTDTFAAGSILYPSPTVAGVWTDVEPVAPNIDMPIGFCINSSVNNGTIAIRVASGYKLSELHDVSITSPLEKASLYYSGGLWRDTTAALLVSDTASMLTPYFRDADTSLLNLTSRFAAKLNISDTAAFARDNQISGTSGQVAYFNSSNSVISDAGLIYNATNKSLGINTTTTSGANLIIKNSQEPSRATVVATQTFAADTTNWTRGTGWTFNGSQAVATAATGALTYTPALTITSGNAYEIRYTLTNYSAGTLTIAFGNGSYLLPTHNVTSNFILILPTTATGGFRFTTSSFTGNIDDVSVVEITNRAPILFAGQDDNSATLYNSLRMPNNFTLAFGGGAANTSSSGVFLGFGTGTNNTTGTNNVFVGSQTGEKNTTGSNNVFFGTNSGRENSIGSQNVIIGNAAGRNNTTGGNNIFIGNSSGFTNTTGANNYFAGSNAGQFNTTGNDNAFIGVSAGQNNTTGSRNVILGTNAGLSNTIGSSNFFFGQSAGRSNTTGNSNIAIGDFTFNQTGVLTTGSSNLIIGLNAGDNITGSASGNVIIGNSADLPDPSGSNQVAIKNVYFAIGASGTGTDIAALSKAGIKTNAPNRDLEVAGEVRITDLTTDAPTRLVGADADGDLGQVTLGTGLSLASSSLLADTSFLVTRFDTASMLTNYLRSGTAASTYLKLTGGTLTGGLAIATAGVPFTVNSINSNTNKIGLSDNGTITSYIGANNTKLFTVANPSTTELMFIDNNGVNRINASGVPMQINSTNSNINKIAFYDAGANTGYIASSSLKPFIVNNSSTNEVASISDAGNASFAGNITEAGNNVLTNLDTASLSSRINLKFNSSGGTISGAVTLSTTTATPATLLGKSTGNVVSNVRLTSPLALAGDSLNLGTVPISKGGTGAESASVARTTLGVGYVFAEVTAGSAVSLTSNRVSIVNTGLFSTTTLDLTPATNGRMYMVKNLAAGTVVSASSNVIPFSGGSPGTAILSAGNVTPQWVTLVADGTNWHVMQKN